MSRLTGRGNAMAKETAAVIVAYTNSEEDIKT
jgi:hypothetical protein